ncbi:MAG: NAD(P)-dependent oxidoreductase [Immundisolibacteraceae bacterium]|nr:NAD(P)-dependent oxidoreductase [Immundisolibacteraceae bacterium]
MSFESVGIIGLGALGTSMCRLLVEDGFEVHGHDIDSSRADNLAAQGVTIQPSAKAIAETADVVVLSLPNSESSKAVCTGPGGICEADKPGLLVIDTTSGYPDTTKEIAAALANQQMRIIDATITGEKGGSIALPERALTWCVGGADADVAQARPLLERMSNYFFHVGPLGAGQIVKMVNNMVGAAAGLASMEGLLAAAKHGIDVKKAAEVLDKGTGMSFFSRNPALMFNDLPNGAGFQLGLMTKDLRHMSKFAHESDVPCLMIDQAFHLFELMVRKVGYDADILSQSEVMQEWAGVKFDGSPTDV